MNWGGIGGATEAHAETFPVEADSGSRERRGLKPHIHFKALIGTTEVVP